MPYSEYEQASAMNVTYSLLLRQDSSKQRLYSLLVQSLAVNTTPVLLQIQQTDCTLLKRRMRAIPNTQMFCRVKYCFVVFRNQDSFTVTAILASRPVCNNIYSIS